MIDWLIPSLTFSRELDVQCPILVLCQHSSLNKILYHFIISQAVSQVLIEVSIRTCWRFIGWWWFFILIMALFKYTSLYVLDSPLGKTTRYIWNWRHRISRTLYNFCQAKKEIKFFFSGNVGKYDVIQTVLTSLTNKPKPRKGKLKLHFNYSDWWIRVRYNNLGAYYTRTTNRPLWRK